MKAQLASPTFSPLYAALISVVNTKFPELGELLCHRVIAQFKRAYKRNDKPITIAAAKFLAHLINQGVLHEVRQQCCYLCCHCCYLEVCFCNI
jgi:pre-mRNA-splicing factor CWC22